MNGGDDGRMMGLGRMTGSGRLAVDLWLLETHRMAIPVKSRRFDH